MTHRDVQGSVLVEFLKVPELEWESYLAAIDREPLLDELLDGTARRMDAAVLSQAGFALEIVCHTEDRTLVRYLSWSADDYVVSKTPPGQGRVVRFEWQRLTDAVRYEFGRVMLESVGLIGRFEMVGTTQDIALLLRSEKVPLGVGAALRSVIGHRDLSGRALDKALRDIDPEPVLTDQQRATNEAVTLFGLLGELDGRVIEWRVGEGAAMVSAQTEYTADVCSTQLGRLKDPSALLHFLRKEDFYMWIMGRANVPGLAIAGALRFDGDFAVIETLGRLPEPFDPVERWGSN